jgi:hypothetical protein
VHTPSHPGASRNKTRSRDRALSGERTSITRSHGAAITESTEMAQRDDPRRGLSPGPVRDARNAPEPAHREVDRLRSYRCQAFSAARSPHQGDQSTLSAVSSIRKSVVPPSASVSVPVNFSVTFWPMYEFSENDSWSYWLSASRLE